MKPEDFESRLSRTPLQPPPAAWREETLAAARAALPVPRHERHPTPRRTPLAILATLWHRWHPLRPAPSAPWAALAGAGLLVLALHGVGRWIDHQAAAPGMPSAAAHDSLAAVIAAARSYHAQVLAVAMLDGTRDAAIDESEPSAQPPDPKAGRPRSHWNPAQPGTVPFVTPLPA
ncbi:MAG: hypothetical protein KF833_00490 [Verrucomicrobiae bacterium]|nr:hypothetical protein [Verrucomicrobiae bacterium]